ncbi:MAG: CoA-binding protein, partial [Dehalococcoidia bacterium]|nr:CoA-binding protein [Dehalococcoidia bacterium]
PGPVDYVIVAVPRKVAPFVLQDCIKKQVGGVMFFTSGFAETNTDEGRALQKTMIDLAKQGNVNLIGPNCVGIYNPAIGLRHSAEQPAGEGGPVGFIAQSGTHATFFSTVGYQHGIRISKSVSYGNAIILDSSDYLEYMAQDKQTKIIGMYIEGVKDGRRFMSTLREAAKRKPVLIWKGGQTAEGARATASHTGSMRESITTWQALIRQCGAIRVDNLDDMVDTVKTLLYVKPTTSTKVGLIAMTGGQSVVISDSFARAGLEIPILTQRSFERFGEFFVAVGGSYRNPLDVSPTFLGFDDSAMLEHLSRMLDILDDDANVDSIVVEVSTPLLAPRIRRNAALVQQMVGLLSDFRSKAKKPFLVVVTPGNQEAQALEIRSALVERNVPSFPTFPRAAQALKKVVEHYIIHSTQPTVAAVAGGRG